MARYNYGQLEQLWQQAGGSGKLAPVMAAIALAESGGRTSATHRDSNGSTDYGLWQINSVHGYNPAKLLGSPVYNAQAAVAVERSSGLGAWSTYNSGAYKKYLAGGSNTPAGWGLPYNPTDTKPTRIDQGVDFVSASPYLAVAPGRVVHIDPNFYNGTPAVYIKLDKPVTVNGHEYKGVYYSETSARVHVGQHVRTGQIVSGPGDAEIGFAAKFGKSSSSWLPAAHGTFNGRDATVAGGDFSSLTVKKGGGGVLSTLSSIGSGIYTGSGLSSVVGAGESVVGAGQSVVGAGESVVSFLGKLTSAAFWLRAAEVIGGGILILLGLYLLARQIGLAPDAVPTPIGQVPLPGKGQAERAAASVQRSAPAPRVVNQYYLEEPASTRRSRLAARASDPATNEIPF